MVLSLKLVKNYNHVHGSYNIQLVLPDKYLRYYDELDNECHANTHNIHEVL